MGLTYGIISDGILKGILNLWDYPLWSDLFYILIFIPGFTIYVLCLISGYEAAKVILDSMFKFNAKIKIDNLLALIFGSLVMAITMELQNTYFLHLWEYKNWYLQDVNLVTIPVVAFILWPLHVLLAVIVFKIYFKKPGKYLMAGDNIR